jgi:hypothetical protein
MTGLIMSGRAPGGVVVVELPAPGDSGGDRPRIGFGRFVCRVRRSGHRRHWRGAGREPPGFAVGYAGAAKDLGYDTVPRERQTPETLAGLQKADAEKWWPIIKELGIKAE